MKIIHPKNPNIIKESWDQLSKIVDFPIGRFETDTYVLSALRTISGYLKLDNGEVVDGYVFDDTDDLTYDGISFSEHLINHQVSDVNNPLVSANDKMLFDKCLKLVEKYNINVLIHQQVMLEDMLINTNLGVAECLQFKDGHIIDGFVVYQCDGLKYNEKNFMESLK